ncbi:hypothetical protein [Hymenobacter sp. BRD67]|uniref:hypothetical protein n=1 Tax=Hymenobacter sp. BRD67 TaxID=2675877 RepID=UPI00293BD2AC|nr:hypothetical protein [Hymenobacter sp. BRD67]
MNTNDANNPMNSGTGAGANYGTSNTGTGLGNSGNTSNESTSYNAGTDYSSATGGATSSDASTLNAGATGSPLSTTSPTTPTNAGDGTSRPGDDYSATAKGAAVAGTAGAAVGRGIDAVENTASRAGHAVEDAATGTNASYDGDYSHTSGIFRDRSSAEKAYQSLHERGYGKDDVNLLMSDDTRKKHFGDDSTHTELGDKAMEGAGVGSAIGARPALSSALSPPSVRR